MRISIAKTLSYSVPLRRMTVAIRSQLALLPAKLTGFFTLAWQLLWNVSLPTAWRCLQRARMALKISRVTVRPFPRSVMTDVLTPEQRHLNMSRVRGRDTKPELLLRRALHARGLRFRLHRRDLPGRPDCVFPRYHTCLLIHGCFWHGHDCSLFQMPSTRRSFWEEKIAKNRRRDRQVKGQLLAAGWRVIVVWECALRGPGRMVFGDVIDYCVNFIKGEGQRLAELKGREPATSRSLCQHEHLR